VAQEPTLSFRLPNAEAVDVYLVKLADGRTVARTREELEELPPEQRGQVMGPAPTTGKS